MNCLLHYFEIQDVAGLELLLDEADRYAILHNSSMFGVETTIYA